MEKRKNKISYTPLQIFFLCLLLVSSVFFYVSDNPFSWREEGSPCTFSYIEQGTYTLQVYCVPSDQENFITVMSDEAIGENGEAGVELSRVSLEPGQSVLTIPLSLEQGIFAVKIKTDRDTEKNTLVTSALLKSDNIIYRDGTFLGVLCILLALFLAIIFARVPREKYQMPLLAALIGLLGGIPLYCEAAIGGNDFAFHLMRIEGIYRGMASGDFPVRLNPMLISGYGYLSSTLYPQLFLYPAAFLRFLNVSLITCHKFVLTFVNVGTALIAYYAMKNITKSEKIGIAMSFLYTFSAYRLICMYMRIALGESLAMMFLPLVLWGVYECLWGQRRWIILTLGMTGVLGSHVLSVEICATFMILELLWWLLDKKKNQIGKRILAGIKATAATILLNCSFLVPFAYFSTQDLECFHMSNAIANSVVYFSQMFSLLLDTNGYSAPRGSTRGDMSLTVGTALLVGLLVFFFWADRKKDEKAEGLQRLGLHSAAYAVIAMLLSSWLMPWGAAIERIPLVSSLTASLQFVWRFLGPASLFLCLCSSVGLVKLLEEKRELNWLAGLMAALCLVSSWTLFDDLKNFKDQHLNPMSMVATIDVDELYLYRGTRSLDYTREEAVPKTANGTRVVYSNYRKDGTHISVDISPLEEGQDYLIFPLYYYPGYEIRINGEKLPALNVDTLTACTLPSVPSHIEVKYVGLPIFWAGDAVSLFTALGLAGIVVGNRIKRKTGKGTGIAKTPT